MYQCDISLLTFTSCKTRSRNINNSFFTSKLGNLHSLIDEEYGVPKEDYYVLCNGKKVDISQDNINQSENVLHVIPRTLGGKGGFGSMLRAIGAQIEKTTNREACRDLSGRRLRDINEEKRLKNWISQQAEREREAAERKKKKLERLCQEPKYNFKDDEYDESRSSMTEKINSSIEQGFKASTSGSCTSIKRKHDLDESSHTLPVKKKKRLWIDTEDSDDSSAESCEESEGNKLNDHVIVCNTKAKDQDGPS